MRNLRGLLPVLLILLLAAFLRLYRLDTLPPGMYSDIATNGLDIRDIFAGHPKVFFPANNGREAFFIYLQALLVAGAGYHLIVFTFAAVAMGMLSVALSFRLFRSMFGYRVALIAAALFAVAIWGVASSRLGLRFTSLPPFVLAVLYLLWRALHSGPSRYAILAGIAVGASMYTYTSARLVPALAVLVCLIEWRLAVKRLPRLAIGAIVAVAIFAPEGLYFLQHPDAMLARAVQVSVFNPQPQVERGTNTPIESILNTAGMFFVHGDEDRRTNIPGRPVFDQPMAAFFVVGLGLTLWRFRDGTAYRWLLAWLLVMSLASALAQSSPDQDRIYSVAPVAFALAAVGLVGVAAAIPHGLARTLLPAAAVAWTLAWTGVLYFGEWAADPETYVAFAGDTYKLALYVADRPEQHMLFAYHLRWPVELLAPRTTQAEWFDLDTAALPIPANPAGDVLYVAQPAAALSGIDAGLLPGLAKLPHTIGRTGQPDFLAFHWPSASARQFLASHRPVEGDMSPDFRLTGYATTFGSGSALLRLLWQPLVPAGPYDLWVHLMDASGKQVAQADVLARAPDDGPTSGYLLLTHHPLPAPPGSYVAEIGATHRAIAHPEQIGGGPIGQVVRLPLVIPGQAT
ncbi:MAG TPA: glycosyltransferase family 39 protein [Chloroflexota bacterium]|nr:glycosyltransferase family 39 protein [Chloroflexota bacterium]